MVRCECSQREASCVAAEVAERRCWASIRSFQKIAGMDQCRSVVPRSLSGSRFCHEPTTSGSRDPCGWLDDLDIVGIERVASPRPPVCAVSPAGREAGQLECRRVVQRECTQAASAAPLAAAAEGRFCACSRFVQRVPRAAVAEGVFLVCFSGTRFWHQAVLFTERGRHFVACDSLDRGRSSLDFGEGGGWSADLASFSGSE